MKKISIAFAFACMALAVLAKDDIASTYMISANPKCNLCRGTGKMMGKTVCKCIRDKTRKSKIVAIPAIRINGAHTLVENGIFGMKFGEAYSNKYYMLSKPWRDKYTNVELKTNNKGRLRTVRVIWFFKDGYPSFDTLYAEVNDLCAIFKMKYGFDIKCNVGSYSRLSSLDTYYNDKSWYVGISCRDGDKLFFDISCKEVPEHERSDITDIQGINDL